MPIANTWGYPVFYGDLREYEYQNQKQLLINTISPNSYGLSVKDIRVKEALQYSDMLVLDGLYFGWAAVISNGKFINRITGWDVFMYFSK